MSRKIKFTLQKAAITVTAIILGILIVGIIICVENAGVVNSTLGSKTFEIIQSESSGDVDTEYFKSKYTRLSDLIADGAETAEAVVAEGAVLLKNENKALPLPSGSRDVSVFGITSVDPVYSGTGSGEMKGKMTDYVTAFKNAGLTMNPTLRDSYADTSVWSTGTYKRSGGGWGGAGGMYIRDVPWSTVSGREGGTFSSYDDAAIFIIGRLGGEGGDLPRTAKGAPDATNGNYLELSPTELTVLQGLAELRQSGTFKRLVVVINSPNPLEADFIKNPAYRIDSALWVGTLGKSGAKAVAKIITGDIVPSGRLSDTFWAKHSQNPVNVNYGGFLYPNAANYIKSTPGNQYVPEETLTAYVVYQEGIYVGYRYTETRYEDYVMNPAKAGDFDYSKTVSYPFGFGESYTTFSYTNYSVKPGDRTYTVSVDVTNTGDTYSAKHTVQIYLQRPYKTYEIDNKIEKPAVDLVGFAKTKVLTPGAKQTLTINIDEKYFAVYDANKEKTYVLTPGDYYLTIGTDAHDAVNNILAAKEFAPGNTSDRMDASGNKDLVKKYSLGLNTDKYSWSDATDTKITNLFDFADINKYEGRGTNNVTYMSRNNWSGTVSLDPNDYVTLEMTRTMADEILAQCPTEYANKLSFDAIPKDNRAYPTYGKDSGLMLISMRVDSEGNKIAYDDPAWDTFMDQLTWAETVTLIANGDSHTEPIESIAKPGSNDGNGPNGWGDGITYATSKKGLATDNNDPLKNESPTGFPANGLLAASFNKELAYEVGRIIGEEGLWSGKTGLYGLGLNIHRSPYLGRTFEYYSEDGLLTGLIAADETKGIQEYGCLVYNKHAVLNDQEAYRHGVCVWLPEQATREIYLRAFELPITESDAMNIMSSFNRLGTKSAPACGELTEGFLRGECGMQGCVVTDCYTDMNGAQGNDPYFELHYGIYTRGVDLALGYGYDGQFAVYKDGGYGEMAWAMRDAAKRVLYSVLHSNAMNGFDSNTRIVKIMPDWQVALIALISVSGTLMLASISWMVLDYVLMRKKSRERVLAV